MHCPKCNSTRITLILEFSNEEYWNLSEKGEIVECQDSVRTDNLGQRLVCSDCHEEYEAIKTEENVYIFGPSLFLLRDFLLRE